MKKRINKEIIIVAIISILFLMMSIVYADYLYNSSRVSFNNNNTTLTSTDVQGAIDELYNKCSNVPAVGTCPEGYECTELNKVTYNANGGSFSGGASTNEVYYNIVESDPIEKISKTSNLTDSGTLAGTCSSSVVTGCMPSGSITDTVTIEGADSLEVEITYQTFGGSYSYVYVIDKNGTNVSEQLSGTTKTTKTYTVTGDTVKFYFYNSANRSNSKSRYYGYYAKIKGTSISREVSNGEYVEPILSQYGYSFKGWTLNQDGSGTLYKNEQEVMDSLNVENKNIILYAKYGPSICKRAITLHTGECSNSGGRCRDSGLHSGGDIINFGQLGTTGVLTSGDAFDCDVNGDGTYDSETERFYYVSDLYVDGSQLSDDAIFDNTYAVLIYYTNTKSNQAATYSYNAWYSNSSITSNGPTTARDNLPKTSGENAWRNDLLKATKRNIKNDAGTVVKSNFDYSGYAARLLTLGEVYKGCYDGTHSISGSKGLLYKCEYLMENASYLFSAIKIKGLWLETSSSNNTVVAYDVNSNLGYVNSEGVTTYDVVGSRPTIEVPKSQISY